MIPFPFSFWKPGVGNGSLLGSAVNNSWFTIPGSSDFAPGTGDFTAEIFMYQTNNGNENFLFSIGGASQTLSVAIASGGNRLNVYVLGSRVANPAVSITLSTWYHVAISRSSGVLNTYFNGTRVNTQASSSNINDPSAVFFVATQDSSSPFGDNWPGNLTNLRFINGTGLYTGATITVPTAPLTAVSNTKLLLLMGTSSTFTTDSSGTGKVVTNAGAATWSSLTPF